MKNSASSTTPPSGDAPRASELFQTGRRAEMAGDLDTARRSYELGLSYDAAQPNWQYRLGCVCLKQGQPDRAEGCFLHAIEGEPDRAAYWTNLGLALDRQGRRDDSVRAYRKAARQPGGSAVACHNLGSIYAEEGRTEEAIRSFEDAIALEPDAEGYLNLGLVHFAREDFQRAMECFDYSVDRDENFALGHYYGGLCLMKRGIYREALLRFDRAWRLDPRLARTPYHQGVCLHKLQKYTEARDCLEQALDFFPEDSRIHYQLALTCDAMGLPQEARLHYGRSRASRTDGGTS